MRRLAILAAALLGLGFGVARAQEGDPGVRSVILRQIEALKADDFAAAFAFASPALRRMFGGADRFGEMVRRGYPMVWRPADVRFGGFESMDGRRVQSVVVIDRRGALHLLDYEMIPDGSGGWLIDGVTVRRPGGAGA